MPSSFGTNIPPEGEGTVIRRNAGHYLPLATTYYARRLLSSAPLLRESKITRWTGTLWHSQRFPYYLYSFSVFSINLQHFPVISAHTRTHTHSNTHTHTQTVTSIYPFIHAPYVFPCNLSSSALYSIAPPTWLPLRLYAVTV